MADIFQTTLWNAFSWMKMLTFRLKFHWSLFPWVQLTIFQQWFRWCLCSEQATSHYLNHWCPIGCRRIYASFGLNELMWKRQHSTPSVAGPRLTIKTVSSIWVRKIRRSWLIFVMGIHVLVRRHLYIETVLRDLPWRPFRFRPVLVVLMVQVNATDKSAGCITLPWVPGNYWGHFSSCIICDRDWISCYFQNIGYM